MRGPSAGIICAMLMVVAPTGAGTATTTPAAALAELAWLAGCWEDSSDRHLRQEQWLQPLGGTMIGMSRTVVSGRTVEYEFLQIRVDGDKLLYIARPSGQAETTFTAVAVSSTQAVFENLDHDFPQRIIYEPGPADSLLASIEGQRDGRMRRIEFPLRRGPCPGE